VIGNPVRAIDTNLNSTQIVLAHASERQLPVLLVSTSEVYGKSTVLPFREDGDIVICSPDRARWAYACSKALDEFLALAYHREHDLPVVVGRLFNTVGPRQTGRYGMVVPTFVNQALAGSPITVFGSGHQQRCFCHVGDVVRGLADLMERDDLYGQVFNLGSTEEVSMLELSARIKTVTGSKSEVVLIPYHEAYGEGFDDPPRRVPDTSKITRTLGWRATATLDETLRSVIEHERNASESLRLDNPQPVAFLGSASSNGSSVKASAGSTGIEPCTNGTAATSHAGAVARLPVSNGAATIDHTGATVWLTGLPAAGKSTLAAALDRELTVRGRHACVLDGDVLRDGLSQDLGFSAADRAEQSRRVAHVASLLGKANLVAIVALVSPYLEDRRRAREIHDQLGLPFLEVWVDTPLAICERRDPKTLYARGRSGQLGGVTGLDAPYEDPAAPDLHVRGYEQEPAEVAKRIAELLVGEADWVPAEVSVT
jgi:UDP-glucose 4-epimerase